MMVVLDATDQVLGRFASVVAKRLLAGEEIHIVNAEKALITGARTALFAEYEVKRGMGNATSHGRNKGPIYPRRPDRIVRRVVRGMLPYQKPQGRAAFKRLRVYVGVPPETQGMTVEAIAAAPVRTAHVLRLEELSRHLGARF